MMNIIRKFIAQVEAINAGLSVEDRLFIEFSRPN